MLGGLKTRLAVAGVAFVLLDAAANAMELQIGTRVPALHNERIIIKNDGGVRNATNAFAFGNTCYSTRHPKTWFIVRRIIGDQVLVEFETDAVVFGLACPDGTETSRPLVEMEARLNMYTRELDAQLFGGIRRPVLPVER